jgi:hypothetical protein
MTSPETAPSFERYIDDLVIELIGKGMTSFAELIVSLPGVYPTVALDSLGRLAKERRIAPRIFRQAQQFIAQPKKKASPFQPLRQVVLPIEHPLDYEWRFEEESAQNLLQKTLALTTAGEQIALLGCPTVLQQAIETVSSRSFTLLDRNPSIVASFATPRAAVSAICCDVTQGRLPNLMAQAVLMDPPWYEEELRAFLRTACQISLPGAYFLVSLPPLGTRPGMPEERRCVLQWAQQQLGLTLRQMEPATLLYQTPPFERNALRHIGIHHLPAHWRRGDLAVFRRTGTVNMEWNGGHSFRNEAHAWREEEISGIRMRIRHSVEEGFHDPSLRTILPGNILPTVSRRDERRAAADVWTSGNRIYVCRGRKILQLMMQAIRTKIPPEKVIVDYLQRPLKKLERRQVGAAEAQLIRLVAQERAEYITP